MIEWEGQFAAFLPFTPPQFVKGGPGRKDVTYERFRSEDDQGRVCQTPWEHIERGVADGNWTTPDGKGFPKTVTPHSYGVSANYVITNPEARRCVDRDMNKVDCQSGAIQIRPTLWGFEGQTCPVAAAEVVTTTCPPTPPPPTPGPPSSPTPPPAGLDSTGNYFLTWAEIKSGVCPARYVNQRSRVGVALLSRRPCSGGGDCEVINIHATEKTGKPYQSQSCYNDAGQFNPNFCRLEGETLPGCQYPPDGFVEDPPGMWIAHPSFAEWPGWGILDKRTSEQDSPVPGRDWRKSHIGHHRSQNESGTLYALACVAGVGPGATFNDVPPGCSRTEISLDAANLVRSLAPRRASAAQLKAWQAEENELARSKAKRLKGGK